MMIIPKFDESLLQDCTRCVQLKATLTQVNFTDGKNVWRRSKEYQGLALDARCGYGRWSRSSSAAECCVSRSLRAWQRKGPGGESSSLFRSFLTLFRMKTQSDYQICCFLLKGDLQPKLDTGEIILLSWINLKICIVSLPWNSSRRSTSRWCFNSWRRYFIYSNT